MGKEKSEEFKLQTVPEDGRFQQQDVSRRCFTAFVDYHKCLKLLGPQNPGCEQLAKIYKAICPNFWITRWEEQLELGTFPLDLPVPPCKKK